ncbi:MAG: SHOCT domain-containing protein [Lachnospiraceae bacterium]|nr:SHOCT domain-containing protein [Lachnospiraceae bacterium]
MEKKIADKIKSIDSGYFLLLGVIGIIISLFMLPLAGTGNELLFIISVITPIISLIVFMYGGISALIEKKNDDNKIIENVNAFQNEYDEYVYKLGLQKSNIHVTLFELTEKMDVFPARIPHYLWIENNMLNLFPMSKYYKEWEICSSSKPDVSKLKLKSIPIESILYFEEIGELRKYTTLSGGGTSLKGALLGYVIADDIGAIIGSREPIKTEVVSEDDRRIELIYKNSENEIVNLEFTHDAYNVFKKLIPLKELRKIVGLNTVQNIDNDINIEIQQTKSAKEKLKQLNEMKKEGLITDEEFLEQRKKILDLF